MININKEITVSQICRRVFIVLFSVYTFFCGGLFALQYYFPNNYFSDTLTQIELGKTKERTYSLVYLCLSILDSLPYGGIFIALFLAFFIGMSVWAAKKVLGLLMPDEDKWILWIYALICNIVFPIFIISLSRHNFKGYLNFNVYHNATYIVMKPFALLSLYFFFRIYNDYTKRTVSLKEWFSFAGAMMVSAYCKPSFMFGFSCALLIALIADFIRCKGKGVKNFIAIGSAVFPSAAIMLYQQSVLFDNDSKLHIGFMTALNASVLHPVIKICASLVFPVIILLFFYKDIIKDKVYKFAWLHMAVNLIITICLYEEGTRLTHGNFFWSSYFAAGVLFIVSVYKYNSLMREKRVYPLALTSMILGVHFFCGLDYFMYILFSRYS